MVTGTHPEEVELFDYVEGDVAPARRAEIEVHLAACVDCAEQVARVQAGREALRGSQFLHLPPRRREAIFMNLPEQRRERGRSPAFSPKQLLAILTPIAAVAAVVIALVSTGNVGSSGGQEAGGAAGATAGQAEQDNNASPEPAAGAFRAVKGPADEVAAQLRARGLEARVVSGKVEVRDATRDQVRQALDKRKAGDVEIVIVP
jgi:anti-sigma factor RsiW